MKKHILPILLVSTMLFSFASCGSNNNSESSSIKDSTPYSFDVKSKQDKVAKGVENSYYESFQVPVSYFNDSNIPYVSLSNVIPLINSFYEGEAGTKFLSYSLEKSGDKSFKITNNLYNETATIDYNKKTITFSDIFLFQNSIYSDKGTVITIYNHNATEKKDPLLRIDGSTYNKGSETIIDLNNYASVQLPYYENEGYIPFTTAFDVLFNKLSSKLTIIGDKLFIILSSSEIKSTSLTSYGEDYYNAAKGLTLSQEELNFNYDETCLYLDYFYGLKDLFNISSFDQFFSQQKLKERMLKSSKDFDIALKSFICHYIEDFHSSYQLSSPYSTSFIPEIEERSNIQTYLDHYYSMLELRYNIMNTTKDDNFVVPGYQVVDDTAIITFNSFSILGSLDKEYENQEEAYVLRLMANSLNKINNDSSIKNVVLDMSCNTGGSLDAGISVISAFLGHCDFSMRNTTNGSTMTTTYTADCNLDGVIDEKDHLRDGLNKYVIGSSLSFSCGNFVPCALKAGGVKVIGQITRGGTCSVTSNASPIGTFYGSSSSYMLCTFKDGIYSHINNGAKPDYPIQNFTSIFDRQALVEGIHTIQETEQA